jgi:hypothetical protein
LVIRDLSKIFIFDKPGSFYYPFIARLAFFGLVYLAGELDRRDRRVPLRIIPKTMIRHNNISKKPLFVAGLFFHAVWLILLRTEMAANLESLLADRLTIILGIVAILIAALVVIRSEMIVSRKKAPPSSSDTKHRETKEAFDYDTLQRHSNFEKRRIARGISPETCESVLDYGPFTRDHCLLRIKKSLLTTHSLVLA